MDIDRKIEAMRERLERSRPAKITITFADGSTTVTDPVGALETFREMGPFGAITNIEADRPEYAGMAGMLSAVCRPVPNRRIEDYE